eukprot:2930275-Pleurochrysis_carterae.AAC.1
MHRGRGVSVHESLCNTADLTVRTPQSRSYALFFSEYHHYEYAFRSHYTPDIGEGRTDFLKCWYSLTSTCVSVSSCFIAYGAS